jgi:hypothetical protein
MGENTGDQLSEAVEAQPAFVYRIRSQSPGHSYCWLHVMIDNRTVYCVFRTPHGHHGHFWAPGCHFLNSSSRTSASAALSDRLTMQSIARMHLHLPGKTHISIYRAPFRAWTAIKCVKRAPKLCPDFLTRSSSKVCILCHVGCNQAILSESVMHIAWLMCSTYHAGCCKMLPVNDSAAEDCSVQELPFGCVLRVLG